MPTGRTPSASETAWLAQATVAMRLGLLVRAVLPNACAMVTANARDDVPLLSDLSALGCAEDPPQPDKTRAAVTETAAAAARVTRRAALLSGRSAADYPTAK